MSVCHYHLCFAVVHAENYQDYDKPYRYKIQKHHKKDTKQKQNKSLSYKMERDISVEIHISFGF